MISVRALLRNYYVMSSLAFVVVLALVWFAGGIFGLASREARLSGVVAVLVVWVLALMVARVVAVRGARLIERLFKRDADDAVLNATPAKREEIKILRERLLKAIDTLKTSKLGHGHGGRAALYELPWYLILGHPAAGKSSALTHAGLNFPFSHKGSAGVQGVGGTRHCDWFFSTEAVLLDTAGRYVTHEEDRGEWIGFLQLLRRHRPRMPLNGVIVAVSVAELTQTAAEYRENLAKRVRERIHEITEKLAIQVPVYVVFTKVDLIAGFAGFFAGFTDPERNQIWGATLGHKQPPDFRPSAAFAAKFLELRHGLHQIASEKLVVTHDPRQKAALFSFPIEFAALEAPIRTFIERVFEDNPYQVRPLFRGMYFTSALQEGLPQSAGARRIARDFGLTGTAAQSGCEATPRSYFLRNLFTDVIFRDRGLVLRAAGPRANLARSAGFGAVMIALALVLGGWTWSFVGNTKLVAAVDAEVRAAGLERQGDLSARLAALDILQGRLDQLYGYRKNGAPWSLGFGLYQGERIEERVREAYFMNLGELMLLPVAASLEAQLNGLAGKPLQPARAPEGEAGGSVERRLERLGEDVNEGYNALKTYLMLSQENRQGDNAKRIEPDHLRQQLPRHWRAWLEANRGTRSMEAITEIAARQINFYADQILEPDVPLVKTQLPLVTSARAVLNDAIRQASAIERVYNRLKSDCNARYAPLTVARILNGKDADVIGGSYALPGCFTREAWDKFLKQALEEASAREVGGTDWVLASTTREDLRAAGAPEKVRGELQALYSAEYAHEWRKFLRAVAVQRPPGFDAELRAITRLADPQGSPIVAILKRAHDETGWDAPIEAKGRKLVNRVLESVQGSDERAKVIDKLELSQGALERQFAELGNFVRGAPGGPVAGPGTPIDTVLQNLNRVKARLASVAAGNRGELAKAFLAQTLGGGGELHEALNFVESTIGARMDQETREAVRPMLLRPLALAAAVLVEPATQELNQQWVAQVYTPWAASVAGRFPFADSASEASPVEVAKFLKPGDGIVARFREQQIGPLVARAGDGYIARRWGDVGINFKPEFLAALSRFAAGGGGVFSESGEGMRFDLRPEPTPELSEITLTIDGRQLRYRNEPQEWYGFSWPGAPQEAGASLQVVGLRGGGETVASHPGKWGFMRLMHRAQVRPIDRSLYRVVFRTSQGYDVRYTLRVEGGGQLVLPATLRGFQLPQQIAE